MDIFYESDDLKRLCMEERTATQKLGAKGAKKLRARLADLEAATRVTDLIAGSPHPLKRDRAGQFAVSLDGACRLVFRPEKVPPPTKDDGSIDWAEVTAVRILFIGDYHD